MNIENARVDLSLKDIAPSKEIRKWFNHEPQKWSEFKMRCFAEIEERRGIPAPLKEKIKGGDVTLSLWLERMAD